MSGVKLKLLAAACENMGIGKNNDLPWKLPKEMKFFQNVSMSTTSSDKKNAVIMGRKTWESIPFRPLFNRLNIVLSRSPDILRQNVPEGVLVADSLDSAIQFVENNDDIENVWIIGGANLYEEAMKHRLCYRIYLTEIQKNYDCDTFFPNIGDDFELLKNHGSESDMVPMEKQTENGVNYYFRIYEKK